MGTQAIDYRADLLDTEEAVEWHHRRRSLYHAGTQCLPGSSHVSLNVKSTAFDRLADACPFSSKLKNKRPFRNVPEARCHIPMKVLLRPTHTISRRTVFSTIVAGIHQPSSCCSSFSQNWHNPETGFGGSPASRNVPIVTPTPFESASSTLAFQRRLESSWVALIEVGHPVMLLYHVRKAECT